MTTDANAQDLRDDKLKQLLSYCDRGWRIFPLWEKDEHGVCKCVQREACERKHPRVKWQHPDPGMCGATWEWDQVTAWHRTWPEADWAVALDDMFVVDVDIKHGGMDTLAAVEENWPGLLGIGTLTQETPSGGRQFFFRQSAERDVYILPQGRLKRLKGFEVKGLRMDGQTGSYVGIPPSRGRTWIDDREPAEATPDLLREVRAARPDSSNGGDWNGDGEAFDWQQALTPGALLDGQQDALYRAACSLRARDETDSLAIPLLRLVVSNFVNTDPNDPWTLNRANEMWDRVKREKSAGKSGAPAFELSEAQLAWARQRAGIADDDPGLPQFVEVIADKTRVEVINLLARQGAAQYIARGERVERVRRSAREFADVPPPDVVMAEVLAAEVNLLGGPSEAGKSLVARDWALHVAAGEAWRGHEVRRARGVLWIASEGTHDFGERWASRPLWEKAADRIFVIDDPVSLLDDADVTRLIGEYAQDEIGLVVLDVIYGMGITDDNGVKDVVPVINALKRISKEWGAATLALGHNGHNGSRRFRGSSMWRQLAAVEHHMADGTLTCEKSKIGDKNRLAASYEVQYPGVKWLTSEQSFKSHVDRMVWIAQEMDAHPDESVLAMARRLAPLFGVTDGRVRQLITEEVKRRKQGR